VESSEVLRADDVRRSLIIFGPQVPGRRRSAWPALAIYPRRNEYVIYHGG